MSPHVSENNKIDIASSRNNDNLTATPSAASKTAAQNKEIITALLAPASITGDSSFWSEFSKMLYVYRFSCFMTDASEETSCYQVNCLDTREELTKSWIALQSLDGSARDAICQNIKEHFTNDPFGILSALQTYANPAGFEISCRAMATFLWLANDSIRAARIGLPVLKALGDEINYDKTFHLLTEITKNIEVALLPEHQQSVRDSETAEVLKQLKDIIKEEQSKY